MDLQSYLRLAFKDKPATGIIILATIAHLGSGYTVINQKVLDTCMAQMDNKTSLSAMTDISQEVH